MRLLFNTHLRKAALRADELLQIAASAELQHQEDVGFGLFDAEEFYDVAVLPDSRTTYKTYGRRNMNKRVRGVSKFGDRKMPGV